MTPPPVPAVPTVFDRSLVRLRRERAGRTWTAADYLHRRAADEIAVRLDAVTRPFGRALDLGSHGGVLGPVLAARASTVVSADSARAMLPGPGGVVADEEAMPFAAGAFDLVVSNLALQAVNDLPGTLAQIARILAPDGLFVAALFGGETLRELRAAFAEAEIEQEGGLSPRVAPFADVRDMGGLLQRAGLALPVTDVDTVTVRYASAQGLIRDLRALGLTNALVARRPALRRATAARALAIYAERFADSDGRVRATFEIVHCAGWAPHESQPKPLRPGSARTSLAQALGTAEIGTGDKASPA